MSVLYGFSGMDLERERELVEDGLKVPLAAHESYYRGGDYYRFNGDDVTLILQENYDCIGDGLEEPDFPRFNVLMGLEGRRLPELERLVAERVSEAVLLRRASG